MNAPEIVRQLGRHAPFTVLGTASGIGLALLMAFLRIPRGTSEMLFWTFHPTHVVLSALVTTAMYRLNRRGGLVRTVLIGYVGSVGIATLSDSLIPFAGEWLLELPHRGFHLGFIEKWWLVNPLALAGIAIAYWWPHTRLPHAAHVFVSTWASLFHMTMAMGSRMTLATVPAVAVFLFLAVWLPCCTSDIVFPLMWRKQQLQQ
jgi:hypothetical protein